MRSSIRILLALCLVGAISAREAAALEVVIETSGGSLTVADADLDGIVDFNATVGALVSIYRTLWKIATLPLLFASGVLYMPSSMPPEVQAVIIWNPFLHCVEALRSTSYLDYMSLYDPVYLHTFATAVLLLSLTVERLFRKEIIRAKGDDDDEEEV